MQTYKADSYTGLLLYVTDTALSEKFPFMGIRSRVIYNYCLKWNTLNSIRGTKNNHIKTIA